MSINKWTYDSCFNEAKKYKSRSEFQKANGSAYQASLRNGWIDGYTWFLKKKMPNGYYDYNRCLEIAKECKCSSEMERKNVAAYNNARRKGWLKDYVWFLSTREVKSRSATKWTREKCFKEAYKYKSRGELKRNNPTVYRKARQNGWLIDYSWFEVRWEKKWDYESCKEESKRFSSRGEFSEKSPSAWYVAKKNGWLDKFEWLQPLKKADGYWNKENCYNVALRCACSSEMSRRYGGAYNVARKNGWVDDYFWFETPKIKALDKQLQSYVIYAYEDQTNKTCYVGLTKNLKKRHASHKRLNHGRSDSVKNYFDSIGQVIPTPIILEKELTPDESRLREEYWKKEYEKKGWCTLNRGATGKNKSSLGGGFVKWDYFSCYREAQKYKSVASFQRHNPSAQRVARENGWQKDYSWFEKPEAYNKKWNYETCKEESKKYSSRGEFSKKAARAWAVAKKNEWIDEYVWLTPKRHVAGYWTETRCHLEAMRYKNLKDFRQNSSACYNVAAKKGWLAQYSWLEKEE